MSPVGKLEQRFIDGTGERYLKTDPSRRRCQGCGYVKMNKIRAREDNPDLTCDDMWPEAQCKDGAEEGTYGCKYHNGVSHERALSQVSPFDYMPVNLREIAQTLAENPEALSQYKEIIELRSRVVQLLLEMEDRPSGSSVWKQIEQATYDIEEGYIAQGVREIRSIMRDVRNQKETWDEIRETNALLDKMRKTQFTVEKELRTMTTQDQLFAAFDTLFDITMNVIDDLVKDETLARHLRTRIRSEIQKAFNLRSNKVR